MSFVASRNLNPKIEDPIKLHLPGDRLLGVIKTALCEVVLRLAGLVIMHLHHEGRSGLDKIGNSRRRRSRHAAWGPSSQCAARYKSSSASARGVALLTVVAFGLQL